MLEICSQVLHRPLAHLELDRSFLAHGGDSLIAIQLITRARKAGLSVTLQELLQSESLRTLCEKVLARNIKLSRLRNKPRGLADIAKTGNLEKDPSSSPHFPDLAKHIGPISLSNVEDVFTCTKSQEAMLAAQARDPCLYQCFVAIKLTSTNQPIDVSLLEAIWKRIVDRQSFLKVVFISSASRIGGFDQVQLKHFHPPLKVLRSSETSEASFCKPLPVTFEPYQPLHQLSILQPSDHDALCKLEFSHALIDGSSAELLLNDLLSTYNGKHNTNPTLSRYDLHRFQNRAILDDYWGTYLKDVQMTQFPLSNPDAEAGNLSTVSCDVVIDIETIREFSNKHAVTISQICQVAWGLVLRIFTSTPDVCFSYVSSGRDIPVPGIEGAAGCFVNLLPCRLQLDGSNNVIRVLNKLKEDFVQSIPYHHVAMNRRGNLATKHGNTIMSFMHRTHEPLGGTGINYKFVTRYVPTDVCSLELSPETCITNLSQFDIAIYVEVHEARFNIELDFWSSKIDTLFAERIGQTFAKAIFSIVSRPQDKIKDLNMLGGLDRFQLGQWNNHQPQPNKGLLHDLVHSQSLTSLGSIAVQSWDGALTYQELDSNAQRLASFLVSLGVKPEVKVALSFAKSIWAVVSQLAVLKAGGAVVSLGISNPLYQLRRIMEDSEATILLVGYTQAMRLSGFAQRVITVDTTLMNNLPDSRFSSLVKPNNCAWIIYTSGSTGNPKGVVLEHTTLCSTIMAHGPAYGYSKKSRVFQFSAYTFDVSIYDVFTTLCFGGCVCVPSEEGRLDNLVDSMRSMQVNTASLTSTVASLIHPEDVPSLKTLVLLGEPARPTVIEEWAAHSTVLNAYVH